MSSGVITTVGQPGDVTDAASVEKALEHVGARATITRARLRAVTRPTDPL